MADKKYDLDSSQKKAVAVVGSSVGSDIGLVSV